MYSAMSRSGSSACRVDHLGDDEVGDLVVEGLAEKDDPLAEQPGVHVPRSLSSGGGLDHIGHVCHAQLLLLSATL